MENIENIRHSLAHLLAAVVLKKWPGAKLGIGPTIENGFYYDFLFANAHKSGHESSQITESDLAAVEEEMRKLIAANLPFSQKRVKPAEARKIFKNQKFKLDLIKEFVKEKKQLSVYKTGDVFVDLCRGGHVKNTLEINSEAFKLTKIAGAYWRGEEKNSMLTRIYGVAFETKEELAEYLAQEEEAKKRDHRKLGQELGIFIIDDIVGKGLPLWLPNGTIVKNEIEKLAIETEDEYGYLRVSTPHIAKKELFIKSGHLPYYRDSMYPGMVMDDGTYYLKAMNCPHHHIIYKSQKRSYRELPLRLAEYGTVYRNERSGTLAGLLRVRMLSMNDAHIYCTKEQIKSELEQVLRMVLYYFKIFGFKDFWFRLSRWDPKNKKKYISEPQNWVYAERALRNVLQEMSVKFVEARDEAAFYGPKIDVQFKSVIGREETMSTIQLDFAAKRRFNLTYTDNKGKEGGEVFVIHRAPLSVHERFTAFLLEHYAGAFPTWLAPVQAKVLPVSEKHLEYALEVFKRLKDNKIRAELGAANETLGKRIREAELQKIPYVLVVGDKENQSKTVSVRKRSKGNVGEKSLPNFLNGIKEEIKSKHF